MLLLLNEEEKKRVNFTKWIHFDFSPMTVGFLNLFLFEYETENQCSPKSVTHSFKIKAQSTYMCIVYSTTYYCSVLYAIYQLYISFIFDLLASFYFSCFCCSCTMHATVFIYVCEKRIEYHHIIIIKIGYRWKIFEISY